MRMPYHIHAIPFKRVNNRIKFALFRRADIGVWQGVVGGGESGESILDTVIRESWEEACVEKIDNIFFLDTVNYMPAYPMYDEYKKHWGIETAVIPMYYFTYECDQEIIISQEHNAFSWVDFEEAIRIMQMSDQRVGLWEINYRIENGLLEREMPDIFTVCQLL